MPGVSSTAVGLLTPSGAVCRSVSSSCSRVVFHRGDGRPLERPPGGRVSSARGFPGRTRRPRGNAGCLPARRSCRRLWRTRSVPVTCVQTPLRRTEPFALLAVGLGGEDQLAGDDVVLQNVLRAVDVVEKQIERSDALLQPVVRRCSIPSAKSTRGTMSNGQTFSVPSSWP